MKEGEMEAIRERAASAAWYTDSSYGKRVMGEDVPALLAEVERLRAVLRDIRDGFDHDSDAHRYGTMCRVCAAEGVIGEREPFAIPTDLSPRDRK